MLRKPFFKSVGSMSYMGPGIAMLGAKNITVGNRVRIYPGSRMETHNGGEIVFEDGCSIGQNFHIISQTSQLRIGKDTTISGNVFVTNADHSYQQVDVHIMQQPVICKETIIGENCFIGYGAVIQAGSKLGRQCVVGSNAVVRGEFPDYSVIVGAPARVVKRYDKEKQEWVRV